MKKFENTKTITVRLRGGLGNQLHGFYAGLFLAQKEKSRLVLDGRLIKLGGNLDRKNEIQHLDFGLEFPGIDFKKSIYLPKSRPTRFLMRPLLSRFAQFYGKCKSEFAISDEHDLMNLSLDQSILLDGYFPSMRYFDELNSKLNFKVPIPIHQSSKYKALRDEMNSKTSLHIRIGDYLLHPEIYPIMSEAYYLEALNYIDCGPNYVIFAEKHEEVVARFPNIASGASAIYSNRDFNTIETFSLLSHSKNLIAANSTFSSWAGKFVSSNNQGMVICPENFLQGNFVDFRP